MIDQRRTQTSDDYCKLVYEFEKMKVAVGFLQAQVQSLTHRFNALSDKVSDQSVVIERLVES